MKEESKKPLLPKSSSEVRLEYDAMSCPDIHISDDKVKKAKKIYRIHEADLEDSSSCSFESQKSKSDDSECNSDEVV